MEVRLLWSTECECSSLTLFTQLNDLHSLSFHVLTHKLKTLLLKVVLQLRVHLKWAKSL